MQSSDDSSLVQQLTTPLSRYPVIKLAIMTAEPVSSHFKMELIQAISTQLDRHSLVASR